MDKIDLIKSDKLRKLYLQYLRRKKHAPKLKENWFSYDTGHNTIIMNYKPLKVSRQFHFSNAKHRAYGGGFGNGKSLALCMECLMMSMEYPGNFGLIGRSSYPELRDTTRKMFFEICPPVLIETFNQQNNHLILKNGSQIVFRALSSKNEEDLGKFKSQNFGFVAIDQAEEVDEEIYDLLIGRLRLTNGPRKSILVFNPEGHNWIWKRFVDDIEKAKRNKDDYNLFIAKSLENPYLPDDYIFSLLTDYPEDWIARYVEGSFDAYKGRIFKDFDKDACMVPEFEIPDNWTRYRTIDWGMLNPCGILWAAVSEDNTLFIYGESYETGLTVPAQAALIRSSRYNMRRNKESSQVEPLSFIWTTIDPTTNRPDPATGETIKQMFDMNGVPTVNANNDVNAGIEKVSQYFIGKKIKIMQNCTNLIDELLNYRWASKKDGDREKPQKINDHLVDALRYLIMSEPTHYDPTKDYYDEETESTFHNKITGY